jgi:hypothetical protein
VARMGEGRGVYRVLVRKPEGKRPLGKPDISQEWHQERGSCEDQAYEGNRPSSDRERAESRRVGGRGSDVSD